MCLVDSIISAMGPRIRIMVALLDIKKAYDKIWQERLIYKMGELGLPAPLVKTTLAWLENRKFKFRVGEERSEQKIVREGLPQSSPLSPILFNVYVKDILQFQESPGPQTFQFADDMAILAVGNTEERCRNKIEAGLEAIPTYLGITIDKNPHPHKHTKRRGGLGQGQTK
ncbi:hypothetical protein Trydic_g582 [Trypoxylus dichotomus]